MPGISEQLASEIVYFVQKLRRLKLKKAPSITESLDWARTLLLLEREVIDPDLARETLNVLLKYEADIARAEKEIPAMVKPNKFYKPGHGRKGEHSRTNTPTDAAGAGNADGNVNGTAGDADANVNRTADTAGGKYPAGGLNPNGPDLSRFEF